jgi:ubiquinone/menaquinone biosynthesis C-methylase UbiE
MDTKKQWDKIHREKLSLFQEEASCQMDKELEKVVATFKTHGVKRILDLACGAGRHTIHLVRRGFEVYGIDISSEGIKIARSQLKKEGLQAHLKIGSIYKTLPYGNNFFDAVVCIRSINHGRIEDIQRTIREIERVLRPGGAIFITTRKRVPKKQRHPFKKIDSHTYIPLEGKEKRIVHYLFTKKTLRETFGNFKVDIGVDSKGNYYCLLGRLRDK